MTKQELLIKYNITEIPNTITLHELCKNTWINIAELSIIYDTSPYNIKKELSNNNIKLPVIPEKEICDLYKLSSLTQEHISSYFNLGINCIYNIIKRNNIVKEIIPLTEEHKQEICRLYAYTSLTKKEICVIFNIKLKRLDLLLMRNNIKKLINVFSLEQELKICELYKTTTHNTVSLAELFITHDGCIGRILKKHKIPIKLLLSPEQESQICNMYKNENHTSTSIAKNMNISQFTVCRTLHKHHIEFNLYYKSKAQKEIFDFISQYVEAKQCNKSLLKGKELDIYIPSKKIAIEYNGLYWHCELNKIESSYHLNKTLECKKYDVQLLHVFEDEWIFKQEIVKSIILNKIGLSETIMARKCSIVEVNSTQATKFIELNHIQGYVHSSINIGLMYHNELVGNMTFGKSRYNKNYSWELIRYCTKLNTSVIGGASKLFSYFTKNHNGTIISYCDLRYGTGKMYEKIGMEYKHTTSPNYFYFHTNKIIRESRLKYQKHKLKKLFPDVYSGDKTESEIMAEKGYHRIYDCGNSVWVYVPNN